MNNSKELKEATTLTSYQAQCQLLFSVYMLFMPLTNVQNHLNSFFATCFLMYLFYSCADWFQAGFLYCIGDR